MKILNVVQLTQSMFADLEQELELSTVFHASAKEVKLGQIIALLSSLLEYETSFEYSMTKAVHSLLSENITSNNDTLCRATTLSAMCRLAPLSRMVALHVQRYSENQETCISEWPLVWCQRSKTVVVTLFEMFKHEAFGVYSCLITSRNEMWEQRLYHVPDKLKNALGAVGQEVTRKRPMLYLQLC